MSPLEDAAETDPSVLQFRWLKYGEKLLLGSRTRRAYFKCSLANETGCEARKFVDSTRAGGGSAAAPTVSYVREHNHPRGCSLAAAAPPSTGGPLQDMPSGVAIGASNTTQPGTACQGADGHGKSSRAGTGTEPLGMGRSMGPVGEPLASGPHPTRESAAASQALGSAVAVSGGQHAYSGCQHTPGAAAVVRGSGPGLAGALGAATASPGRQKAVRSCLREGRAGNKTSLVTAGPAAERGQPAALKRLALPGCLPQDDDRPHPGGTGPIGQRKGNPSKGSGSMQRPRLLLGGLAAGNFMIKPNGGMQPGKRQGPGESTQHQSKRR